MIDTISGAFKNAVAANAAHELNEERHDLMDAQNGKVHGTAYKVIDTVGDTAMNALNVATVGIARKVGNIFDNKEDKLNYSRARQIDGSGKTIDARALDYTSDGVMNARLTGNQIREVPNVSSASESDKEAEA